MEVLERLVPDRPIEALLVDRDSDTRLMYATYLRPFDVELDEAADGRVALAKALARTHDVIVTDTRLPGLNGYDLCRLLRRDDQTKDTPIIVLTAEAFAENVSRAHRAGADAILVKPCLPDALLAEMRRQIQGAYALRERAGEGRTQAAKNIARFRDLIEELQSTDARAAKNIERARGLIERAEKESRQRTLSRRLDRKYTTAPPSPPPNLLCPRCDTPLTYQRSYVGGVSERHREQWDLFECQKGCAVFEYRQRTRKLRIR